MVTVEEIVREIVKRREILEEIAKAVYPILEKSEILKELKALREQFNKMLKNQTEIRDTLVKLSQEQVALRDDFNRMSQEQTRLREEMMALREDFNKLSQEQARLREDFNRMSQEQTRLREDFNKMLEEIRKLWVVHRELRTEVERLRSDILVGFDSVRRFAGLTFEEFVREMLSGRLQLMGVLTRGVKLRKVIIDGEEINLFNDDPLIVGEVTSYTDSVDEVDKLIRKARIAEKKYGRKASLYLIILTAPKDVAKEIKRRAAEENIELIIGREV